MIRGFGSRSQSTRQSLHRVHVDEGGLGISFPSRAAVGSRVWMSRRQWLSDPERKHWATRAENAFDEGGSENGIKNAHLEIRTTIGLIL